MTTLLLEQCLNKRFANWHLSDREPCQWCGNRVDRLWLVPGITPDGRMNKVCLTCAARRYGAEFAAESANRTGGEGPTP